MNLALVFVTLVCLFVRFARRFPRLIGNESPEFRTEIFVPANGTSKSREDGDRLLEDAPESLTDEAPWLRGIDTVQSSAPEVQYGTPVDRSGHPITAHVFNAGRTLALSTRVRRVVTTGAKHCGSKVADDRILHLRGPHVRFPVASIVKGC